MLTFSSFIVSVICFMIQILLLIIHWLRLHYSSKQNKSSGHKWFRLLCKLNVKNVSIAAVIVTLFGRLINIVKSVLQIDGTITPLTVCNVFIKSKISSCGIVKFLSHLFVALRCQINSKHARFSSIWHKIGFLAVLGDLALAIFVWTPPAKIISFYSASTGECDYDFCLMIPIGFAISDLIIGTYCLIIFVIPLRKYIELEKRETGDHSLEQMVKRIILWSSLSLISSMIAVVIVMIVNDTKSWIYTIDYTLNVFCIIMQFGDINVDAISSPIIRKIFGCIQYKFKSTSKMTKHEVNLSQVITSDSCTKTTATAITSNIPTKIKDKPHDSISIDDPTIQNV